MTAGGPALYSPARSEWLASHSEPILHPEIEIVDAHHHLWERPGSIYLAEDFAADASSGHKVIGSVFVDCRSRYRETGPEALRPLGEVEFADEVAEQSARGELGQTGICAGIVGHADLTLGNAVRPVLEAEIAASQRFRGIRHRNAYHTDPTFHRPAVYCPPGLVLDSQFQEGFACLEGLGLSFDAFLFFTQLEELAQLARQFPKTSIVLNHLGTPLGVGVYRDRRDEVFAAWRNGLMQVAACENVTVKLGGLGMTSAGFDFHERPSPPSSEDLAKTWGPYIETTIEAFGPSRSMFESNFPPDKSSCSYAVLWNAFKRMAQPYSEGEVRQLFSGTASEVYALDLRSSAGATPAGPVPRSPE